MILIHPPLSKPCEPPPGIAKLSGFLRQHGKTCVSVDANLEAIYWLMRHQRVSPDKWTARAVRNLERNLKDLKSWRGYENIDRYKRAVSDLNRLVETVYTGNRIRLSLSNYQDEKLSPLRSSDLILASKQPEENPFFPFFQKRLTELIDTHQPLHIGFSLNFLSQALCTFAMIGFLRREFPALKIIVGGGLMTSWMRSPTWQNPFEGMVDNLIAGPGEARLLSILCRDDGHANGHSLPDFDGLPLDDYFSPGRVLPFSASSGCYWNKCSFCPERAEGNPYDTMSDRQVIADLGVLAERTAPLIIHLLDNAVSPSLMQALSKNPPGPKWYGFVRITHHLADPDFCLALKRSGCVMLKLGLESGSQLVIDREHKGMDLAIASKALTALKAAGIATYVYLLFGTPSETLAEARQTLDFTASHAGTIDFLNLAIFNMPIHGPEARQYITRAHYEGDLSLYTGFTHPGGWERGLVRQFLDKEFKRHPAIAPILRNDPPLFTSNHAPFFRWK